mmetsp:Transcript_153947/g.271837  ORF Transcript_153947/g.271837 Transcript_153947/m.271837 type:complete len:244 (+) Transcript_153947:1256-1987(+)
MSEKAQDLQYTNNSYDAKDLDGLYEQLDLRACVVSDFPDELEKKRADHEEVKPIPFPILIYEELPDTRTIARKHATKQFDTEPDVETIVDHDEDSEVCVRIARHVLYLCTHEACERDDANRAVGLEILRVRELLERPPSFPILEFLQLLQLLGADRQVQLQFGQAARLRFGCHICWSRNLTGPDQAFSTLCLLSIILLLACFGFPNLVNYTLPLPGHGRLKATLTSKALCRRAAPSQTSAAAP